MSRAVLSLCALRYAPKSSCTALRSLNNNNKIWFCHLSHNVFCTVAKFWGISYEAPCRFLRRTSTKSVLLYRSVPVPRGWFKLLFVPNLQATFRKYTWGIRFFHWKKNSYRKKNYLYAGFHSLSYPQYPSPVLQSEIRTHHHHSFESIVGFRRRRWTSNLLWQYFSFTHCNVDTRNILLSFTYLWSFNLLIS